MAITQGEIIVGAAGDDISEPNRVEEIVRCYQSGTSKSFSIYSDASLIDQNGTEQGYYSVGCPAGAFEPVSFAKRKFHGVLGATHAWHRSLFELFGPLPKNLTYEDDAIPFRSALIGEVAHIPTALVKYRRHEGSLTHRGKNLRQKEIENMKRFIVLYESNLLDLLCYHHFIAENYDLKETLVFA